MQTGQAQAKAPSGLRTAHQLDDDRIPTGIKMCDGGVLVEGDLRCCRFQGHALAVDIDGVRKIGRETQSGILCDFAENAGRNKSRAAVMAGENMAEVHPWAARAIGYGRPVKLPGAGGESRAGSISLFRSESLGCRVIDIVCGEWPRHGPMLNEAERLQLRLSIRQVALLQSNSRQIEARIVTHQGTGL